MKFCAFFRNSWALGEEMEFVDVNEDDMPDDTWDSFDSFDFNDDLDIPQTNIESAATSTTKTLESTSHTGMPFHSPLTEKNIWMY